MVETRSKTKADLTATEVGRVQRERRERSPRGTRPVSATTTDGASALPDSASIQQAGTVPRAEAQPGPAPERPDARASTRNEANVNAPPKSISSVRSKQSCSENSSRSSATVRAQKLAIEADAIRRQVERERERARQQAERECELARQQAERECELARQQAEREQQLARLEFEAEQTELQAKLAALDASDKSAKSRSSCFSSRNSEIRTNNWVLEQNVNMTKATHPTMPGEGPSVTLGNAPGQLSQPAGLTNTASFFVPNVNRATNAKLTTTDLIKNYDNMAHQQSSERPTDPITNLAQAINALSNRPKKPELTTFSGDINQWMAFKSSYERTKSVFSPSENLDRLNNAVRGPAYQSVASRLWSSVDPEDVMNALEQTYARPELLVAREVAELRNSPKLSSPEDINNLANRLRNFVATVKLLKQNEYLCSPELFRCILIKLSEHTRARFTDFASVYIPEEELITKLELLSRFLLTEADKQLKFNFVADGTIKVPNSAHPSKFQLRKENVHATLLSGDKTPERCTYCKQGPHNIKTCKSFLALKINDRWQWVRENKVCYRCLKSNPHTWNNCRAKRCGVDGCSRRHNALLHGTGTSDGKDIAAPCGHCNYSQVPTAYATDHGHMGCTDNKVEPAISVTNTSDLIINATGSLPSTLRPRGLLKVVPIVLKGPDGEFETTALLDEGSTATLIDGEVAARIGAKPTCHERLRIEGVSGMTKEVEVSYVDFYIRGRNRPDSHLVKHARAIKPLGLRPQNPVTINFSDYGHLSDLSDELPYADTPPTVLIGAPDWHLSLSREVRCGKENEPVASRTLLGWVLHGALPVLPTPVEFVNHISDVFDYPVLKSHHDNDALGTTRGTHCSKHNDKQAIDIVDSSAHPLDNSHHVISLSWKKNIFSYPDAPSHFKSLERQMSNDPTHTGIKSRVLPRELFLFPCLELKVALATTCLARTTRQVDCTEPSGTIFWTLIRVIKWIRSVARAYKPFVRTPGTQFLFKSPCTWPTKGAADEEESSLDSELKSSLVPLLLDNPSSSLAPDLTFFNPWLRFLRATARVLQGSRTFGLKFSIGYKLKLFLDGTTLPYPLHVADIMEIEKMVERQAHVQNVPDELSTL